MKNYTHRIKNRFIPTVYKQDARLENTEINVGPGIAGKDQKGLYNTARIMPLTNNELRTLNNQRKSYEGRVIQSSIKGRKGETKAEFTKFKKPDFMETTFDDFVRPEKTKYNGSIHGKPCLKPTNRNKSISYAGVAANSKKEILSKDDMIFTESKRESYNFEPNPASGSAQYLSNVESFTNYDNQRLTTQYSYTGNTSNTNLTYNNTLENPETTLKEQLMYDKRVGINAENNNYVNTFENPEITLKEQLLHNKQVAINAQNNNYINTLETPETTLKEQLLHNKQVAINVQNNNNYINTLETPETTLKEQLLHNKQVGINVQNNNNYINTLETPETTLKEQLLHNKQVAINMQNNNNYINTLETPETTLKEQLLHNKQVGINVPNNNNYINTLETPETTLKEQLLHNKQVGINVENNNYVNTFVAPDPTLKEQTLHDKKVAINTNINNYSRSKDMEMKPTIKETTLYSIAGSKNAKNKTYVNNKDKARITIKETTLASREGGVNGNGSYANLQDKAKAKVSEAYEKNKYIGPIQSNNKKLVSYEADLNAQIKSNNGLELSKRDVSIGGGKGQIGASTKNKGIFETHSTRHLNRQRIGLNGHHYLNLSSGTAPTQYTRDNFRYNDKNMINNSIGNTLVKNPYVNNVIFQSYVQRK